MKVSVVLPTYNERGHIVRLIKKIHKVLGDIHLDHEIILVDDNSPDGTARTAKKSFPKNRNLKIYIRKRDRGLARSILFGMKKSTGDYIVVMDTDLSHNPVLIKTMLKNIRKADMIIGSRYISGGGMENRARYVLSKLYNIYLRLLLGVSVSDFLSGYFCIQKKFAVKNKLLNKSIFSGYGEYFIRLIFGVSSAGGAIYEVPSFYIERSYGVSKSNLFKMLAGYTLTSLFLLLDRLGLHDK